jgi:hypothetical protein
MLSLKNCVSLYKSKIKKHFPVWITIANPSYFYLCEL